jgi:hypothetical protein
VQRLCTPGDSRGLKAFREDYPEAKAVLSYRGKESFVRDGIPAMPVGDFLTALSSRWESFPRVTASIHIPTAWGADRFFGPVMTKG